MSESLVVRLDADTVRRLEQMKRQIDSALPDGAIPPFTLAALARHSIRKWADHIAEPVPNPCLTPAQERDAAGALEQARQDLQEGR
ncbi:hypothetical protein [Halomonas sp. Y3]|uniref:hypothetical protein n=1 Tax=Halomonas sp. Y3 TaxID=2956797 RepID=UPI00209C7B89|nr:hypothetical protein [Halomonas sp. Y3]